MTMSNIASQLAARESLLRDPKLKQIPREIIAEHICRRYNFAQDPSHELWVFENGAYRPEGAELVRYEAMALMERCGKAHIWRKAPIEEIVEYVRLSIPRWLGQGRGVPLLWERPPPDRINVRNGILDLETSKLSPHDPAFLSTVQLPIEYNTEATCPAWDTFTSQVFPRDCVEAQVPYEIFARLIRPDNQQFAYLLIGVGGNGKSTFLRSIASALGSNNVSALSLHALESNRFASADLYGKLANICSDLPSDDLKSTAIFKAITGGDDLMVERKFRNAFKFRPFAHLLFSANHYPRSKDASLAFFDRFIVIPFTRRFRTTKAERDFDQLKAELAQPNELSGLLNKALSQYEKIREYGYTVTPSMVAAGNEFRNLTDPLTAWVQENVHSSYSAMVGREYLFSQYNASCARSGRPAISERAFNARLEEVRPNIRSAQRHWRGSKTRVWLGIDLGRNRDLEVDWSKVPSIPP